MIREFYDAFPLWVTLPLMTGSGTLLGIVYFRSIGFSVKFAIDDNRPVLAVAAGVGRFLFLAGVLLLASLCGALPLLFVSMGLMLGRFMVIKRVREAA